ncbi:MAG: cytochrome c oxidase subunit 3 [Gammaproteobacteria bacterium]|nr:cytochrome c oxidase subunit 3 [Gammaproteobacteria bacterium]
MNIFRALTQKPWLPDEDSSVIEIHPDGAVVLDSAKVALRLFLAVVATLFSLFIAAYFVRMEVPDWRPLAEPGLLWVNTGVLFLASIALQWTRQATFRENLTQIKLGLLAGMALTAAFLGGQLWVWQQLMADGYYAVGNPANAFFYLITAIHCVHIAGGLFVWTRTATRVWRGAEAYQIRLSVELCTVYWHFLLLVWLGVFWVLLST